MINTYKTIRGKYTMILSWTHNQETGMLTCEINENLKYTTLDGGGNLVKTYNGEITNIPGDQAWEDEKHWISDNFSNLVGVYAPKWDITTESWTESNPTWIGAVPLYGITDDGLYLDKLARTSYIQEGHDMQTVYKVDRIWIEQDKNGDYWKREWCEEQDIHYNCQPCCVFPYNPGRTKMDKAEAESIINEADEQHTNIGTSAPGGMGETT